ncbi:MULTISPECIES: NUDIX domain-containing protein [unclassified Pseudofrankia]|uniref:NUDIX domain-containing protein n=1 Tax=unclassified Pseudofrankia TaxID=2994372 RepID=UPI0008DA2F63|nr:MULTISPECIES: NUDIX domain-containing protein [unclassified Pseudofrankia]MDT3443509.1 NUDIX domain-containing protein [Pseudofrankia sp. BMG5.37]OHV42717.1 NUDIX hydrolase [Pseudofrankia sp. BMG5.36]
MSDVFDPVRPVGSQVAANSLVVGGSAIVTDEGGRILLERRRDNGRWGLPGGGMQIGEWFVDCVVREVREETGFEVRVDRVVGVYSNPGHVMVYADGERRQEFSVCCACTIIGGELRVSHESTAVEFVAVDDLDQLEFHESARQRISDYLEGGLPVLR